MNQKFAIMPDVTCDLSKEMQEKFDIEVVNGHYITPDGTEHRTAFAWTEAERDAFYKELKSKPNDFSSAPPNIAEWCAAFEPYVKAGIPIIAITISSAVSGTFGFLCKAAEAMRETYPNAEIYTMDSRRFSAGFGLMAVVASLLREEGKSAKEVYDFLEQNKNRIHQTGWMDDLSFVAKKGRISNAKAFFGMLVGIKPIGEFDYNGMTTVIGKVKGEKAAFAALLEYMARHIEKPEEQVILVATSNRQEQAKKFAEMIQTRFSPKAVYLSDVFQNDGINIGPGLMAAYYFGKPITEDLAEEKACFADILAGK